MSLGRGDIIVHHETYILHQVRIITGNGPYMRIPPSPLSSARIIFWIHKDEKINQYKQGRNSCTVLSIFNYWY